MSDALGGEVGFWIGYESGIGQRDWILIWCLRQTLGGDGWWV